VEFLHGFTPTLWQKMLAADGPRPFDDPSVDAVAFARLQRAVGRDGILDVAVRAAIGNQCRSSP